MSTAKLTTPTRATAESMASKQRDISVSEFFAKNRHLLGFDNPRKAILTTVKEAVDNSLDACEEAGILPDITVVLEDLQPDRAAAAKSSRYRVTVVDNGPGIVRRQVENVFGRLLFGSKFHRLKMSRGQQGIGISAAGMYGLITTGKPMMIQTRPSANKPAHHIELAMNTKTNRAEVTVDEETDDFPLARLSGLHPSVREMTDKGEFLSKNDYPTGTSVSIELEGKYQRGRGSVDEFLELTAIANPHAKFTFVRPTRESAAEEEDIPLLKGRGTPPPAPTKGEAGPGGSDSPDPTKKQAPAITQDLGAVIVFPRGVSELPPETKEIQPHPKGIELGTLLQMLKDYEQSEKGGTLYHFLQEKFCRVSHQTAAMFCERIGVSSRTKAGDIEPQQAEKLYKEFQDAKLAPPPTDCLAPIGVRQLLAGLLKGVRAEFYAASSREPDVYRGRPFQIEAAIAFGGELPTEDTSRVIRFANRVPLLFQQSACSSFKSVTETNWRNYDLQQPRGGLPIGPLVIMIHTASVWVPFTSESKEAIADYDEIRKEMKLALMECGRKLGTYLKKRAKMRREGERRDVFQKYIGEIAKACNAITGVDAKALYAALLEQAKRKTAIADVELDEDGKAIKESDPSEQEGVIIIPTEKDEPGSSNLVTSDGPRPGRGGGSGGNKVSADPFTLSKAEKAMQAVAARAKEDEEPQLIDTRPIGRLNKKGESEKPTSRGGSKAPPSKPEKAAAKSTKAEPQKSPPSKPKNATPAPRAGGGVEVKTPAPQGKGGSGGSGGAKPKMRLVNGKLVPVDEPRLF